MISQELINKLSEKIDDKVKLGFGLEVIDGFLIKAILKWVNNKYFDKIPEHLKDESIEFLQAFADDNPQGMTDAGFDAVKEVIGSILFKKLN